MKRKKNKAEFNVELLQFFFLNKFLFSLLRVFTAIQNKHLKATTRIINT